MSKARQTSIVSRLTRLIALFALLVLVSTGVGLVAYESLTLSSRINEKAMKGARYLGEVLVPALEFDDVATATKQLGALKYDDDMLAAAVYLVSGDRFADVVFVRPLREPIADEMERAWVGLKADRFGCLAPISSGEKIIGHVWLLQKVPTWTERLLAHGAGLTMTVLSLLALGLAVAISLRRTITRPIVELAKTAQRVTDRKDYVVEVAVKGTDEIADLAKSFNDMLKAISLRDLVLMESKARLAGQNLGLIRQAKAQRDHTGDLDAQFSTLSEITSSVLAVERLGIWLLSKDGQKLVARDVFERSQHKHTSGEELRTGDYPEYLKALLTQRCIEADDALNNRWTREFADNYLRPHGIGALLDVPIRWRGELVGVLRIEHQGGRRSWHADEISFGLSTADRIVLMLETEEARLAEIQLRESEERFRNIIDQARDAIFTLSPDGKILGLNASVEEITGWDRANWMDLQLEEVIHDDDREIARKHFAEVLAGGTPPWFLLRIYSKKHDVLTLEFAVSARRQSGKVVGMLGIGRDVTERAQASEARERLESQLRQVQKMDAIGMLAGGIAHDFNNILTAIIGNAQLVELDVPEDHPAREGVSSILTASHRAKDLVKQILTFSRRQEQKQAPFSLDVILREAHQLLRPTLPSTIEIKLSIVPGLPSVMADPSQIHQVIMNLATNAMHAMVDQSGVLELGLDEVVVDQAMVNVHPQLNIGRCVRLRVSDTGCGMEAATVDHIFEPFFTTKGPGQGTGLGLAVVHGIVSQHKGEIIVYSSPGKGTLFQIYFPVIATTDSAASMARKPVITSSAHGERILIVDDEAFIVTVTARILRNAGYRVDAAAHPTSALAVFQSAPHNYDLVLSDYTMPAMKGTALAREIRLLRSDIPIILMTGFAGAIDDSVLGDLSLPHMLQKPFTAEALLSTVQTALALSARKTDA